MAQMAEIRAKVKSMYDSRDWRYKVDCMKDNQVFMIYKNASVPGRGRRLDPCLKDILVKNGMDVSEVNRMPAYAIYDAAGCFKRKEENYHQLTLAEIEEYYG